MASLRAWKTNPGISQVCIMLSFSQFSLHKTKWYNCFISSEGHWFWEGIDCIQFFLARPFQFLNPTFHSTETEKLLTLNCNCKQKQPTTTYGQNYLQQPNEPACCFRPTSSNGLNFTTLQNTWHSTTEKNCLVGLHRQLDSIIFCCVQHVFYPKQQQCHQL